MINFKQLFCKHRYGIKEWYPLDEEGQRLFKDTGLLVSCEKCDKFIVLFPKNPKEKEKKKKLKTSISKKYISKIQAEHFKKLKKIANESTTKRRNHNE
jgi:hypothetical protein